MFLTLFIYFIIMVEYPNKKQSYNTKKMLFKIIFSLTSIMFFMIQVASFSVYYGGLADWSTNNAFVNINDILQESQFGWWASYVIGGMIMIGPLDYYITMSDVNGNYSLILTIIGIMFVSSIMIGLHMKHYHPIGGFLLGFLSIAFFNIVIYLSITSGSTLLSKYGIDPSMMNNIQSVITSVLQGIYHEDISSMLFRGIFINGLVMGIFGSFWTAVFMPSKASKKPKLIKVKCNDGKGTCILPPLLKYN